MGYIFTAKDTVEMAIQIEKNGRDFYNTSLKQVNKEKLKKIFAYLSGEEENHIVAFQNLLKEVENKNEPESYLGEYDNYIKNLARENVFTKKVTGKKIAKKIKSDKQAVDTALGFEKDSILLFTGIKSIVQGSNRKIVDELIRQEQNHFIILSDFKKKLT